MSSHEERVKKLCSFYVSDMHLGTMLLPYLSEKLEKENFVYTVLNRDIKSEISKILSSLNLKQENRISIESINWNHNEITKYSVFEEELDRLLRDYQNIILLIVGTEEYMDRNNQYLEKYLEKKKDLLLQKDNKITIINCYEVMQFNNEIKDILDKHDRILNTSGEKEMEEIFEGYQKNNKKLAQ